MRNERIVNQLRAFHYLSGVLKNQQDDPLCGKCLALEKVSNITMDNFLKCESDCRSKGEYFSEELHGLFRRIYDQLSAIQHPDELIGQKKREIAGCLKVFALLWLRFHYMKTWEISFDLRA